MTEVANLAEGTLSLTTAIHAARDALLALQRDDGHWCFELEADCTITAEYILMMHYVDEIDEDLERKFAVHLREKQNSAGGWPLYFGGEVDLSCTVKVYYALKLAGDSPDAPHMQRTRNWILQAGGAAHTNVFTRITLALFEQVPWRAVPFIPVEVMLLPRWFPFHLSKVSYWSRAVMVPLFILCSLKPSAKNPRKIHIPELFTTPAGQEKHYFKTHTPLSRIFLALDKMGRAIEPLIPKKMRRAAIAKAEQWFTQRLNGEDGLGAIFPAMASSYKSLLLLGYAPDHHYCEQARQAMRKLLVINQNSAYCQPCLSPVWDTALSALALQTENSAQSVKAAERALNWLKPLQILEGPADWRDYNPQLAPGGWAFEYRNDYYPDLDDTGVVGWAMQAQKSSDYAESIRRAADWLAGMQSRNGGFAAFDQNNQHYYLNEIPFADHGALLDPPTSDVTARCLTFFSLIKRPQDQAIIARCLEFLFKEQEPNGAWFGRWGTNYIYGTWSVLVALKAANIDSQHPAVRRAVDWLQAKQHGDGGWGESNNSYYDAANDQQPSTAYQTAWALLALMSAGEVHSATVARGIQYLLRTQQANGFWHDSWFTAPGFPRVFYLRYDGYGKYFPLVGASSIQKTLHRGKMTAMTEIRKIGVVCGLPIEARCLAKQLLPVGQTAALKNNMLLHTAGMGPDRARSAAMYLIDSGVSALISWGTAGGLAPGLTAGQLILPNQIIDQKNNTFNIDTAWRNQLLGELDKRVIINHGLLLQSEKIVAVTSSKRQLFTEYQAVAVDMESGAVAEVAQRERIPFIAIRSIVDTADFAFPQWLQASLNSEGEIQLRSLGKRLSLRPLRLKDLIQLSSAFNAAKSTLNKIGDLLLTEKPTTIPSYAEIAPIG